MTDEQTEGAEGTAVRVALWRALHVQVDAPPHVLEDEVGLQWPLPPTAGAPAGHGSRRHPVVPGRHRRPRPVRRGPGRRASGSRRRPVRHSGCGSRHVRPAKAGARIPPPGLRSRSARTAGLEASPAGRARYGVPQWVRLVPVDFEGGGSWWEQLLAADFDPARPAVVVSTGVTLYLRRTRTWPLSARWRSSPPRRRSPRRSSCRRTGLRRPSPRVRGGRERCARRPGRRSSASPRRTRCWHWRASRIPRGRARLRPPFNARRISRSGRTASARRGERNCSSPRPDAFPR